MGSGNNQEEMSLGQMVTNFSEKCWKHIIPSSGFLFSCLKSLHAVHTCRSLHCCSYISFFGCVNGMDLKYRFSFTFSHSLIGFPGLVLPAFDKGHILSVKRITADSYFCSLCIGFAHYVLV